jgi:hypothetical protein
VKTKRIMVSKQIVTFEQLWRTIDAVERAVEADKIQWVVVDNLTSLGNTLMTDIRSTKVQKKGKGGGGQKVTKTVIPTGKPDIADFGMITYRMEMLLNRLTEMKTNMVITAWSKSDRKSGFLSPRCETEAIADMAAGMCDYVLHIKAIEDANGDADMAVDPTNPPPVQHILYTKQNDEFLARDRSGVLPAAMEPDFAEIIPALEEAGL